MKILIVGWFAELVDLIVHLQEEGHDVYYYVETEADRDIGKGLIHLIKGWKSHIEDADLILFPDVYFKDLPKQYREKGKLVIGGSAITDKLENDREFAAEVWKRFGLRVPETFHFTSFDDAIKWLEENPGRYVFKPMGQKPRFYTYVAEDEDDMAVVLKHFKEIWRGKPDFVLQKYIDGVEVAVTGVFNGKKFLKPYIINFEHKKIGNGDRGPNSGESGTVLIPKYTSKLAQESILKVAPVLKLADFRGFFDLNLIVSYEDGKPYVLEATCFTEDVEIATFEGWKKYDQVNPGDVVFTLDLGTGQIDWSLVKENRIYEYDGPIVHFHNRWMDVTVTPDHEVLVLEEEGIKRIKAGLLIGQEVDIPVRAPRLTGYRTDVIALPELPEYGIPPKPMKTEDLFFLLGVFLQCGWHDGAVCEFIFHSHKQCARVYKEIADICGEENIALKESNKERGISRIEVYDPQLCRFFEILGFPKGRYIDKFIPPLLYQYSPLLLKRVIDGLTCYEPELRYSSNDDRMIDGVQILYQLMGWRGALNDWKSARVKVIKPGGDDTGRKMKVTHEPYKGYVWCPVVPPHHTVLVRQNGKTFFCGQCRPGIPTIHIVDGLMEGEWGTFLRDVAAGKEPVFPLRNEWCVGAVVMSPPWPYEIRTKKFSDFPLEFPWRLVKKRKLHLGDVKVKKLDDDLLFVTAGSVGFTMVATGTGKTIDEAQKELYEKVLPQVKFSLGWWRTDIGERVKKEVKFLKKLGYL